VVVVKWTEEDLTLLLGLFYFRPFREGDASNEVNHRIAVSLARSRGSIDMQWRNTQTLVRGRGARTAISQTLQDLVERFRDAPTQAIEYASGIAMAARPELRDLLPDTGSLDSSPFGLTVSAKTDMRVDTALFGMIWKRPELVLLRNELTDGDWRWIEARMNRMAKTLRPRARTIYAVLNRIEEGKPVLKEAGRGLQPLLQQDYSELTAAATAVCEQEGWCVWTYL
jgi:hypothetical protein